MVTRVAWFDAEEWEKEYLENVEDLDIEFFDQPLNDKTAEEATGFDAVTVFVSSDVGSSVISKIDADIICCRSTGYDHVDLEAAKENNVEVYNVPAYGATTVAEHTFGLMLSLSRKIYQAVRKVEEGSFSHEGLRGFDLEGKTLGVIGTGAIGREVIKRARGFGMNVIASDPYPNYEAEHELGFMYVSKNDLLKKADIVSLHCPLTDSTRYMLSEDEFELMQNTVLINTARGELIDTSALLKALKSDNVSAAGLDVLEDECFVTEDLEVTDLKEDCDLQKVLEDHILIDRDDVLVTPHNAFNSQEAMERIVDKTVENVVNRANPVCR